MARAGIYPQKKNLVYVRNFTNRLLHWTMFFSVMVLLPTGYYIGNPTALFGHGEAYNQFIMADIRVYHFFAAMALDISIMLRFYLAFFSMYHRDWFEVLPIPSRIIGAIQIARSYLTFKKPPFYRHVDPLDGLTFLCLHLFMVLQLVTGFHLYAHALPGNYWWSRLIHLGTDWVVPVFGSDQAVRNVHHLMLWITIAGIIMHVYIQVIKTIIWRDGHISAIVGGYKYRDVK
ncbi:MAG: Ni/Fe-hydrogenase, b-type cytochrome subunit [Nitrospinae bacterium]|nr:Ni/Fe-hydrogenase, b-type cytochrome subunit [Nitrospinota bacterium]